MMTRLAMVAATSALIVLGRPIGQAAAADTPAPAAVACTYHDLKYSDKALICLAPHVLQQCTDKGWVSYNEEGDFKTACENGLIPAPGAAATPPGQCSYHDVPYAPGAVICVASHFAQTCDKNKTGVWTEITNVGPSAEACENAPIPIPAPATAATSTTIPPGLCTYHDVHYAPNAVICVAPAYSQTCGDHASWSAPKEDNHCKNAQTPAPTGAAASAAGK